MLNRKAGKGRKLCQRISGVSTVTPIGSSMSAITSIGMGCSSQMHVIGSGSMIRNTSSCTWSASYSLRAASSISVSHRLHRRSWSRVRWRFEEAMRFVPQIPRWLVALSSITIWKFTSSIDKHHPTFPSCSRRCNANSRLPGLATVLLSKTLSPTLT